MLIELKVIGGLNGNLKIKFCWGDLFSFVRNSWFFKMTGPFLVNHLKNITVNKKYYYTTL